MTRAVLTRSDRARNEFLGVDPAGPDEHVYCDAGTIDCVHGSIDAFAAFYDQLDI